jgi:hypothetical protein
MADINPAIPMSMNYGTSPFIQAADIRKSLADADAQNLDTAIKMEKQKKYNTAQSIIKKNYSASDPNWAEKAVEGLYDFSPDMADMFIKDYAEHLSNKLKSKQQATYNQMYPQARGMLEQTTNQSQWPGVPMPQTQDQQALPEPAQAQQMPVQEQQMPVQEQQMPVQAIPQQVPPLPAQEQPPVAAQPPVAQPYTYQPQLTPQQNAMAYGSMGPDSGLAEEQQITANMVTPGQTLGQMIGQPLDQTVTGGRSASVTAPAEPVPGKPAVNRLTTDLSGLIYGNTTPATKKERDYLDRYMEYVINPAREALSHIEPALSVKDNASAFYRAQAAGNKSAELTPNQKVKYAEWTEDQWQKFYKFTTPLAGSSRNALGIAGISNVRAQRAFQMLQDPSVVIDPQMLSLVLDDIMYIFRGGVPTESSKEASVYRNAQTWLANIFQKVTSDPQLLSAPGMITQMQNVLNSILQVDNKVIDRNLGHAKPTFQRIIDDDLANNNGARALAFYGGLMGTKDLDVPPIARPGQRFPEKVSRIEEVKAIALDPNTPDAERVKAERYLDKLKVSFRKSK